MEPSALIAFMVVAAALIVLPGPDWALVLAAGLRSRAVGPAVAGLAIGYALITAALVFGLAPLVAAAPAALFALTLLGAVYLIWVGVGILRQPAPGLATPQPDHVVVGSTALAVRPSNVTRQVLRQGVGVSSLNPKSLLFFLAFLPQFARPAASWPFGVQLAVLGAVWILMAATFYSVLGLTLQRALDRHPALGGMIARLAGVAMVLAGIALLAERAVALV